MFRIRRIYDDTLPIDKAAIAQVQQILKAQFSLLSDREIAKLPEQLRNPLKYRFRSILFVADDATGNIKGFAHLLHAPDLRFCYLDFISAARGTTGGGIGGALYERIRAEALALNTVGLFFECLPDDPALCPHPDLLKQNAARLRFYERYGAYPIADTTYETPLKPGDQCPPYLVYDNLGQSVSLRRETARSVAQAVLERKYGRTCPPGYIEMVIGSFRDDPVRFRPPRYVRGERTAQPIRIRPGQKSIALVVNEQHEIHHVRERGYVQSPVRIRSILKTIEDTNLFERMAPHHFSERHIKSVHDPQFVEYLKRVCARVEPGKSIYPYVFPIRNAARPPKELPVRAGYFCIDTFTPLNENAYKAAKGAVDCALTAAHSILQGYRFAYALIRPPGHHAERRVFGGFCYFNSAAVAANYLSAYGKVAVLDIDYHHGNGTQDIFYERSDVMTTSLHGHPRFAYPYFSGFEDERGSGPGQGYNVNIPLPEHCDPLGYREALSTVLKRIGRFRPYVLVVSLGLDIAKGDPTGSWNLQARDFELVGHLIGSLGLPTVVVQEGGYRIPSLGSNARHFFLGLWAGSSSRDHRDRIPFQNFRSPE